MIHIAKYGFFKKELTGAGAKEERRRMDEVNIIWMGRELLVFESKGQLYASMDKTVNTMLVEYVTCRALYTGDGLDGYGKVITSAMVSLHVWLYLFAWRRMTDAHEEYLGSIGLDFAKGTTLVLKLYLRELKRDDFVFGVNVFPYRVIRCSGGVSVGLNSSMTSKCDPAHVQLMALSGFVHVFDIARFCQSIGLRSAYYDILAETLNYAVCYIRQIYIRSRFEYVSTLKVRDNLVEHHTPPDIKRLDELSIRLHLLFPCKTTCESCFKYSIDGDITSISTLSYSVGGQYVTPIIAEIRRQALQFD